MSYISGARKVRVMARYDVIVVGAGIIGAAVSYYSAKKGLKVALVDKKYPASGASGACNGGLSYFGKSGKLLQDAYDSLILYRELAKELDYPIEICQDELFVQLATIEEEIAELEKNVEECKRFGLDAEMVSKSKLHSLIPGLSNKPIGGAIAQGGLHGFVNPFTVIYGYLDKVKKLEGTIIPNWEVVGILTSGRKVKGVVNKKEEALYAPVVVISSGFETAYLLQSLNLTLNIMPNRGVVLVTEKAPWKLKKKLMGANFGSTGQNVSLCIEQTLEGNLLIGSSQEIGVLIREPNIDLIARIANNALSFYPSLGKVNIIRAFTGVRPHREEGPFLGEIKEYEGLFVASGHGGMGITLAPWTGRTVALMIAS